GDFRCGIGYDEFATYRNGLGKFTKSYRRGDTDCGIGYDEFATYRNGLGKFTSPTAAETAYTSDVSVATATPPRATFQVIGIPQGDYLNVREGAEPDYQVATNLAPGTGGILLGIKRVANGATTWQQITVHRRAGW